MGREVAERSRVTLTREVPLETSLAFYFPGWQSQGDFVVFPFHSHLKRWSVWKFMSLKKKNKFMSLTSLIHNRFRAAKWFCDQDCAVIMSLLQDGGKCHTSCQINAKDSNARVIQSKKPCRILTRKQMVWSYGFGLESRLPSRAICDPLFFLL